MGAGGEPGGKSTSNAGRFCTAVMKTVAGKSAFLPRPTNEEIKMMPEEKKTLWRGEKRKIIWIKSKKVFGNDFFEREANKSRRRRI